jgi:hypothetical protein
MKESNDKYGGVETTNFVPKEGEPLEDVPMGTQVLSEYLNVEKDACKVVELSSEDGMSHYEIKECEEETQVEMGRVKNEVADA